MRGNGATFLAINHTVKQALCAAEHSLKAPHVALTKCDTGLSHGCDTFFPHREG